MASVKEFPSERIRNVAVLGHGGSGKTTLVDALCYLGGTSNRLGDVEAGHALTMTTPEEAKHGFSMQVTPAYTEWLETKVNLLDTPGYLDFAGEALAASRVVDSAIVVVGATQGVQAGTETVWEYCDRAALPRLVFVSMMDRENTDFEETYRAMKEQLSEKIVPVEIPVGEGEDFRGIINLFSERAHLYTEGTDSGEYEVGEIPPELQERFETWFTELQETLATTDEGLLEKYLEGEKITRDEAVEAMARGVAQGEVIPVFCGSASKTYGLRALLKKVVELLPAPTERGGFPASAPDGEEVFLEGRDDEPFAALVFKTTSEPHVGEISYFRVFSGVAQDGMEAANAGRDATEKLAGLSVALGKNRIPVPRLHAGDLGAVTKLKVTRTNDTLSATERPVVLPPIDFPAPDIAVAVRGGSRADDDKLGEVLPRLEAEDPSFRAEFDSELGQTIVRGLGELHLGIQLERLQRRYSVSAETEEPRIAYRETLGREAEGKARFKKQTGGRGQFGECHVRIRPLSRGEGYEFVNSIKGGAIPGKFVPSVDRGIQEAAQKGFLAGYPVVDFQVECFDGKYHPVDSSDVAFQVAGSMAFKDAAAKAEPMLLEPIMEVVVAAPDDAVGDVMGDITQRRGKVLGMDSEGGKTTVRARVPEAELYKYAASLRAMTQGRAHHSRSFVGYEPVPEGVAQRIIEERTQATA